MYIPTAFRENDRDTLLSFMRAHSFVALVSIIDGVPFASHIPVTVETRGETVVLTGHVAKANAHARAFDDGDHEPKHDDAHATHGVDVQASLARSLAIFTGPHAYVSPTVYEQAESVPTWNYIAVHATGVPRAIRVDHSPEAMRAMLDRMIAQYDPSYGVQWDALSSRYRDGMMRGVVAFEMPVERIEGKYKLSQNRSTHDQAAVAAALEARDDATAQDVARAMRARA